MKISLIFLFVVVAVVVANEWQETQAVKIAWYAFNGGGSRPGINYNETAISVSTVSQLRQLWKTALPDLVDSSPVLMPDVSTSNGVVDLVIVNGRKSGVLMALNAATGQLVWQNTVPPGVGGGCGLGMYTKSTPAIDPSGLYVYAYRLDGYIHCYDIATGAENSAAPGFPAIMTLIPTLEQGSSSINIINGFLYMTLSGYNGDCGHYVGHVVSVNLKTGENLVWNSLCSNMRELLTANASDRNYCAEKESGVWARSGAVLEPLDGSIYIATGNGEFDANEGGDNFGDSILKLSAGLPMVSDVLLDSFTPADYEKMEDYDEDLGSSAPCILPPQPKSSTPYMLVQASKDQVLRLINRQNLSGKGCCGHVGGEVFTIPITGLVFTAPIAWQDPATGTTWVFVANGHALWSYNVVTNANGQSSLSLIRTQTNIIGTSPFIANNVLFVQCANAIYALNPTTGAKLWTSPNTGPIHWQSPIVVNGQLFAVDENSNAYSFGFD